MFYLLRRKAKALIIRTVTAQLMCVFDFAYLFSRDAAQSVNELFCMCRMKYPKGHN